MENVNWLKLKLNQQKANMKQVKTELNQSSLTNDSAANNLVKQTNNNIINNVQRQFVNPQQLRMNNLASIDRAVYIKNMLNLPKNMVEFFVMVQNDTKNKLLQNNEQIIQQQNPNAQKTDVSQQVHHNKPQINNRPHIQADKNNQPVQNQQGNINNTDDLMQNRHEQIKNNVLNTAQNIAKNPQQVHHNKPQINNHPHIQADKNNQPVQNQQGNVNNTDDLMQNRHEQIKNNVFNTSQNLAKNTQQHINHNVINSPHSQLHNTVRNNVRNNNIILNNQTQQNTDTINQLQTGKTPQAMSPEELTNLKQQLASQLDSNINITHVSAFLQKNSKIAMNKMISMMSMAAATGMGDIKPLQDTMNIINASVSATSQNDTTNTLKDLMLLYLPWLPLQEGVGFDLEVEQDESEAKSEVFIKILITTINYGSLNATVSLITGNSVDVSIICSEKFPKKTLLKKLQKESSQHSMQSTIDFQEQKPQEQLNVENAKAKVNLSNANQVNPYLLLMAHALIRYTIEIDATVSIGNQPIED